MNHKARAGYLLDIVQPIVAVCLGIAFALLAVQLMGDSPTHVMQVLIKSAFGTREDLGMTLFYATPLIFTGLSVAIAFQSGLFNIGAEGQLLMGALGVASVGILFPNVPPILAPVLGVWVAMICGAVFGFIPGWLRARRGSHEVINTIMLNFISAGITSYFVLYFLKSPENQNPETTPIAAPYRLMQLSYFGDVPLNLAFVMAIVVAILVWILLWRTSLGFEMRAVGENEEAARQVGIDSARMRILAMTLAGAIAGLVGVNEVMGATGKFTIGFSPEYGFMGIAVALLGRNRPLGVVASALLFGALHKGSLDLDLETEKVTRDFSLVLQALIILAVSSREFWDKSMNWIKAKVGA